MKEALKLALEALEIFAASYSDGNEAIIAIKEALAQPEHEPVHSVQSNGRHSPLLTHMMNKRTTQPKRPWGKPWVSLTDEPTYTEQQIANACWAAEISDSKCESLLIALQEATPNIGVKP